MLSPCDWKKHNYQLAVLPGVTPRAGSGRASSQSDDIGPLRYFHIPGQTGLALGFNPITYSLKDRIHAG